ncbi:MAG: c-type cytochrome [Anaerolineales bacterium]|nr:c-type cytochrome [Anaerolineales bacterium]
MNKAERQEYLEEYKEAKEKGHPFFPYILFKDAVIALVVFLILIALAFFVGVPTEPRADPGDTAYTPRPEWYFLFLFQLLKYFPGQLEVVGVFVIPTLAVILLFILPFLDRSRYRHFTKRPIITGVATISVIGIAFLTYQAFAEAPPLLPAVVGDEIALLYTENCSTCHGASVAVEPGADLHNIIAQGRHEDMPAWSADLTSDEIDALAGFILSPAGNRLFTEQCSQCHEVSELVASDPLELRTALEDGTGYSPHADVEIPEWGELLSRADRTALLNFLVAPDGQRLYATNCSSCHGQAVGFAGEEAELQEIINQGGLHLEMPPWQGTLSPSQIDTLAAFVLDPSNVPDGELLFQQNCSQCHGERIPASADLETARQVIATGGSHETMPVWGDVLTEEQLDALVSYTLAASRGTSLEAGQQLFVDNCAACHGEFGEGGPNPARPDDIIAPISTAEYLTTRDDFTLRSIISQGQPNFGMSPFGSPFGGPLDDDEVDAIVAYMRSWEADPPVELPPEIAQGPISLTGAEIFADLCIQCHGELGEGSEIAPALNHPGFQDENSDQDIFDTINLGHEATPMIAWGNILSADQIEQLVTFIRELGEANSSDPTQAGPASSPSFAADVLPVFDEHCAACHGTLGGWDGSSYETVMTTGNNAPVVIPGDPENSLLAQKIVGTQTVGAMMPPAGLMSEEEIQVVLDWIASGALDN